MTVTEISPAQVLAERAPVVVIEASNGTLLAHTTPTCSDAMGDRLLGGKRLAKEDAAFAVATGTVTACELCVARTVAVPAPVAHVEPTEDVAAWLVGLGRKADPEDVTASRRDAALVWLAEADAEGFDYLVDMKARQASSKTLSVGMVKGVLNCWRARLLKAAKPVTPVESDGYIPARGDVHIIDGTYFRVHFGQTSHKPYVVKAIVLAEAVWEDGVIVKAGVIEWDFVKGGLYKLSQKTRASAEQAAAFGKLVGRCCFCSTPIDTVESTAMGYGPKCASDRGLPWGSKLQEVAV